MCMCKKQKNEDNVLNSYVKYRVNEKEKRNDGNILTIFLIFWLFSSCRFL